MLRLLAITSKPDPPAGILVDAKPAFAAFGLAGFHVEVVSNVGIANQYIMRGIALFSNSSNTAHSVADEKLQTGFIKGGFIKAGKWEPLHSHEVGRSRRGRGSLPNECHAGREQKAAITQSVQV